MTSCWRRGFLVVGVDAVMRVVAGPLGIIDDDEVDEVEEVSAEEREWLPLRRLCSGD